MFVICGILGKILAKVFIDCGEKTTGGGKGYYLISPHALYVCACVCQTACFSFIEKGSCLTFLKAENTLSYISHTVAYIITPVDLQR